MDRNKSTNPKVSVILPTYNRARLLGKAVRSVLNQTYKDLEVIVVDDCSTDNTKEVVKSLDDERIIYIQNMKNRGAASARNTGIEVANGKYIAFQDSDDLWLRDKLEKQICAFEESTPKTGVVYTGFWRIDNHGKTYIPSKWISKKEGDIHKVLLEGNFVGGVTAVTRKTCLEKVGMFDERLPRFQDWELFLRLSKFYLFKYINEPLLLSYQSRDSISADDEALTSALEIILRKHFDDFSKYGKILARHYLDMSFSCFGRDMRKVIHYMIEAAGLDPYIIFSICPRLLSNILAKTHS